MVDSIIDFIGIILNSEYIREFYLLLQQLQTDSHELEQGCVGSTRH